MMTYLYRASNLKSTINFNGPATCDGGPFLVGFNCKTYFEHARV